MKCPMLIKLTDRCTMCCAHCLDDAREDGHDMSFETFIYSVSFGLYLGCTHFVLSGGEPTLNPKILTMCDLLDKGSHPFSIVSNGMWLKDPKKCEEIAKITQMESFVSMQVYTNKHWYKEYDYVVSHKKDYEAYNKVIVVVDAPIHMKDLGRARTNDVAQSEVHNDTHFMSCLNASLCAKQVQRPWDFGYTLTMNGKFCVPSIDSFGRVHMSESRLCPIVGDVTKDNFDAIWYAMQEFRPCGRCHEYKRFMESDKSDIVRARKVLVL